MVSKALDFCSLENYLRAHHGAVHEAFVSACATWMLRPRQEGATILVPTGAALKELAGIKDSMQYVSALKSLVIPLKIADLSELDRYRSDLPNLLQQNLGVKSVDSKAAVLENGAKITPDPKFKARADRDLLAAFLIDKLPKTDNPSTKHVPRKMSPKTGKGELKSEGRYQLAIELKNEALVSNSLQCYLNAVGSMLLYLRKRNPRAYQECRKVMSPNPLASFLILFEPFKHSAHTYVSNADFAKWATQRITHAPLTELLNAMKCSLSAADVRNIKNARNQICDNINKVETPAAVQKAYPSKHKLCQDELRYIVHLQCAGSARVSDYLTGLYLVAQAHLNFNSNTPFLNNNSYRDLIAPVEQFGSGVLGFVLSSAFMYQAVSESDAKKLPGLTKCVNDVRPMSQLVNFLVKEYEDLNRNYHNPKADLDFLRDLLK